MMTKSHNKSNDGVVKRYAELEENTSLHAIYHIRALTKKRPDKLENEDCIAIEHYGIFQEETYLEGQLKESATIALADGVSSASPFSAEAAYVATLSYLNRDDLEDLNQAVLATSGKTTLEGIRLQGNLLEVTHVGDSSIILVRKGKAIALTFPHDMGAKETLQSGKPCPYALLENYFGRAEYHDLDTGKYRCRLEDQDCIYLLSDGVEKLFWKRNLDRHIRKKRLMEKVKKKKRLFDDTSLIEIRIQLI